MSKHQSRLALVGAISLCMACLWSTSLAESLPGGQIPLQLPKAQHSSSFNPPDPTNLHRINIDYSEEEPAGRSNALLKYLASTEAPKDIVREISVTGYPSLGNWTLLADVFGQVVGLWDIYWDAEKAIPKDVITSLDEKNPLSRLHYTLSFSNWDPFDDDVPWARPVGREPHHHRRSEARESVIGSRTLYSLKAAIHYGASPNLRDMDLIFRILSTCPNLRELDLSIDRSGCVMSGGQPYAFNFLSNSDVKFPPLEVLSLSGYRFDTESSGGSSWDFVTLPGFHDRAIRRRQNWPWSILPRFVMEGINEVWDVFDYTKRDVMKFWQKREKEKLSDGKTSLDLWLEVMDWSHLHTLNLKSPRTQTMTKLSGEALPKLKNLTLSYPGSHHAAIDFIANTSLPLESLSLQDMNFCSLGPVEEAISKSHSKSLKYLAIHQSESVWGQDTPIITFNTTELSHLLTSCSKLQKLEIDMPRHPLSIANNDSDNLQMAQFPLTIYGFPALAPELEHLIFHFPSPDIDLGGMTSYNYSMNLPDRKKDDIPDPQISHDSVTGLFKLLRREKVGKELTRMDVYIGNWEAQYRPRGMASRPRKRIACYICEVDTEKGEICEGGQTRNGE